MNSLSVSAMMTRPDRSRSIVHVGEKEKRKTVGGGDVAERSSRARSSLHEKGQRMLDASETITKPAWRLVAARHAGGGLESNRFGFKNRVGGSRHNQETLDDGDDFLPSPTLPLWPRKVHHIRGGGRARQTEKKKKKCGAVTFYSVVPFVRVKIRAGRSQKACGTLMSEALP